MTHAGANPFNTQRIHALPYALADWDALLARLQALGRRAAVVGPHGHGKTTLLGELGARLAGLGYRTRWLGLRSPGGARGYVAEGLADLGRDEVVLLDGAEQLGWRGWRRVLGWTRGAAGLVITTHAPGRLPRLHECRTGPVLLDRLLEELVGADAARWRTRAHRLLEEHDGDLRSVWFALYDCAARE